MFSCEAWCRLSIIRRRKKVCVIIPRKFLLIVNTHKNKKSYFNRLVRQRVYCKCAMGVLMKLYRFIDKNIK